MTRLPYQLPETPRESLVERSIPTSRSRRYVVQPTLNPLGARHGSVVGSAQIGLSLQKRTYQLVHLCYGEIADPREKRIPPLAAV